MGDYDHVVNFDDFELLDDDIGGNNNNKFIMYCRICHEAEFESSSKEFEAPCACSGTSKYAHRDCIQRWCDEKGNTVCEICLQKYQGGYTAQEKKAQQIGITSSVTIRESLQVPRREHMIQNPVTLAMSEGGFVNSEFASATDKSASFCRSVAIIVMILLLMNNFHDVLNGGTRGYPFTLLTILMLRMSGIVIPMYLVMKGISAIQNSIRRHRHHQLCQGEEIHHQDGSV